MKIKEVIKILLPLAVVVIASVFMYHSLLDFFSGFSGQLEMNHHIKSEIRAQFHPKIFFLCFFFLFGLLSLPFLFSVFAYKLKIDKNNWWKSILFLELAGLIVAYLCTPPDMISTVIYVVLWQVGVIVNLIVLLAITKNTP